MRRIQHNLCIFVTPISQGQPNWAVSCCVCMSHLAQLGSIMLCVHVTFCPIGLYHAVCACHISPNWAVSCCVCMSHLAQLGSIMLCVHVHIVPFISEHFSPLRFVKDEVSSFVCKPSDFANQHRQLFIEHSSIFSCL